MALSYLDNCFNSFYLNQTKTQTHKNERMNKETFISVSTMPLYVVQNIDDAETEKNFTILYHLFIAGFQ